ncbi:MAG: hypothetical protein E7435_03060 [Ruminococcaceae bacterium]|nr:hypothetical protein [Oscillospiraceae bacterium]
MKRTLLLLISTVVIMLWLTPLTSGSAVQNSVDANETGLLNKSNNYQLSNEQLNAPTDRLVDIILSYPYLVDLFCGSGTKDVAYDLLKENFNGLAELEKRTDALPVLREKFQIAKSETIEAVFLERLISIYSKMFPLG